MKLNQIIEVVVAEVEPGYVNVDFEGRPATLQITELTWKPGKLYSADYFSVGQKIRVKVIAIANNEFSVSLREASLGGNPWNDPPQVGDEYFAPVVRLCDYGYFFEITYFCYALMMKENATDTFQIGDRIRVKVSKVDVERKRVDVLPV